MAPQYKLTYFPTRGWAEPIRFLLSYGGIEFEDVRVTFEEWPQLKNGTPWGHLPVIEYDGKQAGESIAIARYVAKQVNLAGHDAWEDLEIDSVVDTIKDICTKISGVRAEKDPEKLKTLKENVEKEVLPYYLTRLDASVQKNNGYLAVGRLTWVDLFFVSLSEAMDAIVGLNVLKEYQHLNALKVKVFEIPNIEKWVKIRPQSSI